MTKILIAGLGSVGRRHLRNLVKLGDGGEEPRTDILLYRTYRSSATPPKLDLADFPVVTNLEAALAWKPDAVVVANPTAFHLDVAIPAARAGCHLLLEKPVSHSLERVEELQLAVESGGGQVLVGYQFRFHPGLQKIAAMLAEGAIGRPLSARAHWGEHLPGWHPWEDYRQGYSARADLGGGVILTLSHPLDYLRWLLGEVEALWAFAGQVSDLEIDVEDVAEIVLRFESGALGSLHLDYYQQPPAHYLEIIGTQGTLRWGFPSSQTSDTANPTVSVWKGSANSNGWECFPAPSGSILPPGFERNQMFLAEMRHFLQIIQGKAEPVCNLQDGIKALRLALAASESARERKIWSV